MASGRGGSREGAGRKKKAEAYKGEATTAVRIPTSVAEPVLALLSDGKRVTVKDADSQPVPGSEVERLEDEITKLREREAELVELTNELLRDFNKKKHQFAQLSEQLVRLKDERQQLAEQIEALHQAQRQPSLPALPPEAVQGAIATLLEAINTPANMSNRVKVAQALRLLGAEVPEGKARGKRQKS